MTTRLHIPGVVRRTAEALTGQWMMWVGPLSTARVKRSVSAPMTLGYGGEVSLGHRIVLGRDGDESGERNGAGEEALVGERGVVPRYLRVA